MKKKRLICVLLAMAFVFIACTNQGPSDTSGTPAAQTTQGTTTTSAAPEPQVRERGKISATIYDRGNVPASEGTIEENRWTEWINENGPVDVTFVAIPRTNPGDKLNVLFASGSAPDLVFEYSPNVKATLYQQKQLMPIEEMINQYSTVYKELLEQYPALNSAGRMDDGQLYQFGKINEVGLTRAVVIRTDWLENLNLEIPVTVEDYYNVVRAFAKDDPDGNGVDDTYGMGLGYRAGESFNQMIPGGEIGYVDKSTGWDYTWDRLQERLEFKKRMYDEGLVEREFMTDTDGSRTLQDFVNGKLGILPWLGIQSMAIDLHKSLRENVPEARLQFIHYPQTGHGTYIPTLNNPVQMTAVVNAKCEDPEAVMQYVDFVCAKDFAITIQNGLEGVHFQYENGIPRPIDTDKNKIERSWAGDFGMLISIPTVADIKDYSLGLNLDDPLDRECYELYKQGMNLYLNPSIELKYTDYSHSEHMPQPPAELATLRANLGLNEYYDKAVVSGSSYTVEQAIADAKAEWDLAGAHKLLEWYQNWYENDSENSLSADDMFELIRESDILDRFTY